MIATEEEAKAWLVDTLHVSRETMLRLNAFADLLRRENEQQNLVSRSTLTTLWVRHFADSAQLLLHAPGPLATWLDIGSGAGFPGLIIAALMEGAVTLVEPRRLRADFLGRAAAELGVSPRIVAAKVERIGPTQFDVISARAFASLPATLQAANAFSTEKTRWILPKGRGAQSELEAARATWHGEFRLVPSLTDPDASIIVAEGVRPRVSSGRQRKPE